ncbi:MAG: hypothetical protein LIO93_00455 [Bacteroidales bacterium]|nr:hypothetical protein [Bacteroidales bacterium]
MERTHMNPTNKLTNVSFVIPVRIDSYERSRNLDLLIEFITSHFDSPVYIAEGDSEQKYTVKNPSGQITYHFIEDRNPVFQHTLYLNYLYQQVKTPITAGWDTDALVFPQQIIDVVKQIEIGKAVMGLPYNGSMYGTEPHHISLYEENKDIDIFKQNTPYMFPMYGSLSSGGAFIVSTEKYLQAGGDNEHFLGWGPEDMERVKRMEIVYPEYPIYRAAGSLFHLWHPRFLNSGYADETYEKTGRKEYLKICSMETGELKKYIDTWPWKAKWSTI